MMPQNDDDARDGEQAETGKHGDVVFHFPCTLFTIVTRSCPSDEIKPALLFDATRTATSAMIQSEMKICSKVVMSIGTE